MKPLTKPAAKPAPVARKPVAKAPPKRPPKARAELPLDWEAPDPFEDLPDPGEFEKPEDEAAAELGALEKGFRDRAKREAERLADAGLNYYSLLVFSSGEECEAFQKAVGALAGALIMDGREVAERLGIELPPARKAPGLKRVDSDFAARARGVGED